MFTEFNGPQLDALRGARTSDITALIDAYSRLSSKLEGAFEGDNSILSQAKNYADTVVAALKQTVLGTNAATFITDTIDNERHQSVLDAINALNDYIKSVAIKASENESALENKIDKDELDSGDRIIRKSYVDEALENKIDASRLTTTDNNRIITKEDLDGLESDISDVIEQYYKPDEDDNNLWHIMSDFIEATKYVTGCIKAKKYIDFTQWQTVSAQFAGTGAEETHTAGIYLIAKVSDIYDDWKVIGDNHAIQYKPCRLFVKYVDHHNFDAILDVVVARGKDGKVTGTITATVAKEKGSWQNLAFHVVEGSDVHGKMSCYIGVSADNLYIQEAVDNLNNMEVSYERLPYTNLTFRVSGINCIPLDDKDAGRASVLHTLASTATIGAIEESAFVVSTIAVKSIATDAIMSLSGKTLLSIFEKSNNDATGSEESLVFDGHPKVRVKEESTGEYKYYNLVTEKDLELALVPIGGMIDWYNYETIYSKSAVLPNGKPMEVGHPAVAFPGDNETWLACRAEDYDADKIQGVAYDNSKFPELAEKLHKVNSFLTTSGESSKETPEDYMAVGKFRVPVADFKIIHAAKPNATAYDISALLTPEFLKNYIDSVVASSNPEAVEAILSFIKRETNARTDADNALGDRITQEIGDRESESADNALDTSIQGAYESINNVSGTIKSESGKSSENLWEIMRILTGHDVYTSVDSLPTTSDGEWHTGDMVCVISSGIASVYRAVVDSSSTPALVAWSKA